MITYCPAGHEKTNPISIAIDIILDRAEHFSGSSPTEDNVKEKKHFRLDISVTTWALSAFLGVRAAFMNDDNENIQENHQAFWELLSKARSGNQASMGRLADIVRERLFPFVYRTTLDHDLTEDVLQETLLTMVGQVARLRDKSRFWPWVFRIAWSKIQDNLRRRQHHSYGKASFFQKQSHENHAGGGSLLDATIHAERLQRLSKLVEQLSWQHKDILRLRYYEQLPYTKIAALTRTTPQKARARFYRAKKYLKAQLKDDTQLGTSIVV